jgi:hypothetical protein
MAGKLRDLPKGLLSALRYQSHSGRLIRQHRALRRLNFQRANVLHPIVLVAASYTALYLLLPEITRAWGLLFGFWLDVLGRPALLTTIPEDVFGIFLFALAVPETIARQPGAAEIGIAASLALGAMLASYLAGRRRWLPLVYFVWGCAAIQLVACAYFYVAPYRYPHTLASHVADGLRAGTSLLLVVPLLLSFTYYVFDHSLPKKLLGTLVIFAALAICIPVLYLAHVVLVLECSLVIMPLLFTVLGTLYQIALFVALYAWVVSWEP